MSKVKTKKKTQSVVSNGPSKEIIKKKKRTFFFDTSSFKSVEDKIKKPTAKTPYIAPPKNPKDYSCNWKKLLQTIAAKPEKDEVTKHKKDSQVKGRPSSKDPDKSENNFKKPKKSIKPASERPGRAGKDGDQQKGKDHTGHKQFKAEKRKRKDNIGNVLNKKSHIDQEEEKKAVPDIWFDDVDMDDIKSALGPEAADIVRKSKGISKSDNDTESKLVKDHAFEGVTRAIAMDCEMVGVGYDGKDSILARISIVNQFGKCIYDKYVKPTENVTDYRTFVSGIRPEDIEHGEDFKTVQKEVAQIMEGRILVGHAIHNDLKILLLNHPKKMIRDTQKYKPFRNTAKTSRPALRVLCKEILNVNVQQGEHSSVQDAQATMRLYTMVKKDWEAELKRARAGNAQKTPRTPRPPKNSE
ncbi:hypothetical protein DNTS_004652 [Danionella cerebrum]|uniref:RNA exonuclease 4 n=1 Tax=Danionella cerebrum TaxID=2873325 RepID=A0A553QYT3_9TELE|nr:hypothetical protein DNTS_004652 [Danionella translucida]